MQALLSVAISLGFSLYQLQITGYYHLVALLKHLKRDSDADGVYNRLNNKLIGHNIKLVVTIKL